jgi:hypothetical protein
MKAVGLMLASVLCSGAKPADDSMRLAARFTGQVTMEGNLVTDPAVDIVARGPGEVKGIGSLTTTELRWTVKREVVLGLLAGTIREAPVNTGSFTGQTEDGSLVTGVFRATVTRKGRWFFVVRGNCEISGGTGLLEGVTGGGEIRGTLDVRDASYVGSLKGEFALPR